MTVRLWREVDALAGWFEEGDEDAEGYNRGISDVLTILERRGFTEHADPLDRLAQVEANAEVLVVARHDLMVAVDQSTKVLREGAEHAANEVAIVEMLAGEVHEAADLLDRLAAYMKGQDDRLIAMGDVVEERGRFIQAGTATAADLRTRTIERDEARAAWATWRDSRNDLALRLNARDAELASLRTAARVSGDLIRESAPVVRFVQELAALTDGECNAPGFAHAIRTAAQGKFRDDATFPRLYTDEDRERAITIVSATPLDGHGWTLRASLGRIALGKVVDAVAQALGLTRAST